MPDAYANLFGDFTSHSDEKLQVALAVGELMAEHGLRRVLDVGAGSGEVARHLSDACEFLCLLESNAAFEPRLRELASERCQVLVADARAFQWSGEPFDLVLASYLLESISERREWPALIERLLALRSPGGRLYGVTHLSGCPWEHYAIAARRAIGDQALSAGGSAKVFPIALDAGFEVSVHKLAKAEIFSEDIERLFERLAFFFRRHVPEYLAAKPRLLGVLERLVLAGEGRVSLGVTEVVYQIG